jgi:tRNA-dependent cyclodipeptide synthase
MTTMKELESRHALFAISLSNERFSTEFVVPAVDSLLDRYDEITFLIADKLQLYNSALRFYATLGHNADGQRVRPFDAESRLSSTLNERKRWLNRVREHAGAKATHVKWNILSVEDISDSRAFAILRRVNILLGIDQHFRADIRGAALDYAARHQQFPETAALLSEKYIIEEIALSVRLRVISEIFDEYYIGTSLKPIVHIYQNKYLASPWELAGLEARPDMKFRFFDASATAGLWEEVRD